MKCFKEVDIFRFQQDARTQMAHAHLYAWSPRWRLAFFHQIRSFNKNWRGPRCDLTKMTLLFPPYYRKVQIMEVERFSDSWFQLVCRTIDHADCTSAGRPNQRINARLVLLLFLYVTTSFFIINDWNSWNFTFYMYVLKCLFTYPLMATEMVEAQIFKKWLKHYVFLPKILSIQLEC